MRIQSNQKLVAAALIFILGTAPVAMGRPAPRPDRDGVVRQAMLVIRRLLGGISPNGMPSPPIPAEPAAPIEPITTSENGLPSPPIP